MIEAAPVVQEESTKFYSVVNAQGRAYHYHITDYEKAVRSAKKAATEGRGEDAYIMTTTALVRSPVPEAELIEIK